MGDGHQEFETQMSALAPSRKLAKSKAENGKVLMQVPSSKHERAKSQKYQPLTFSVDYVTIANNTDLGNRHKVSDTPYKKPVFSYKLPKSTSPLKR